MVSAPERAVKQIVQQQPDDGRSHKKKIRERMAGRPNSNSGRCAAPAATGAGRGCMAADAGDGVAWGRSTATGWNGTGAATETAADGAEWDRAAFNCILSRR